MKYTWLLVVFVGIAGIYLGMPRHQVQHTETFGEYPCFLCASVEPDFAVLVFSAVDCPACDYAVERVQRFCRLTGVLYVNTVYDNTDAAAENLAALNLEKQSDILIVVLHENTVIKTSTSTEDVESFLSETIKEAAHL